jgi:hypothetical protein
MPFEVRGGIALHASKLWNFIQGWRRLEEDCFGTTLVTFGKEAKGAKLLDRDRFKWAADAARMPDADRRKLARQFLEKGREKSAPTRAQFSAYGQASLEMARGAFELLLAHDAQLFASLIPRGTKPPANFQYEDYLRKDQVFLLERYYYFLEAKHEHGLLVMDESDKSLDRAFVRRLEAYFKNTAVGRNRSYWIVPSPLFVASDMTYAVQAADLCLYCINWGFRLSFWGEHPQRGEIATEFGPKIRRLQWSGQGYRDGQVYDSFGVVMVPDPYEARQ